MRLSGALSATLLLASVLIASQLQAQQIYDNGDISTGATLSGGGAAPGGYTWSEMDAASGTLGFSSSVASGFRAYDDFIVPAAETWTITSVVVLSYQTSYVGATSPITAGTLQIWSGDPFTGGSVVAGDTTTDVFSSSTQALVYRVTNNANNTLREVWSVELQLATPLVATTGTYWIDWQTTSVGGSHFSPPVTIAGLLGKPGANAQQSNGTPQACVDGTTPQDFPFKLNGSVAGTGDPEIALSETGLGALTDGQTVSGLTFATGVQDNGDFTITNQGAANVLNVTAVNIAATGAGNCTVSITGITLPANVAAAGGTAAFTGLITPTADGAVEFTLTITSNDADEGTFTVIFQGTASTVPVPEMDVLRNGTTSITDGGTEAATNTGTALFTANYTIANTGTATLNLTGGVGTEVVIGAQTNCTVVVTQPLSSAIAATSSTTFSLDITPTAAGAFSFTVSIANDDSNEDPYNWTFNGNTASGGGGGGGGGGGDDGGCSTNTTGFAWLVLLAVLSVVVVGVRSRRARA